MLVCADIVAIGSGEVEAKALHAEKFTPAEQQRMVPFYGRQ
jgi:hypothetical protein